jgi:phage gp16-like protein
MSAIIQWHQNSDNKFSKTKEEAKKPTQLTKLATKYQTFRPAEL